MLKRAFTGLPPRITFTRDFHELVGGDLRPGTHLVLRYDPARIVPAGEGYVFGDPMHRIVAHIICRPGTEIISVLLHSPVGMLADIDADPTGDGSMLIGSAHIPESATALEMWFTHDGPYGSTNYDSDLGRNFHFGFASRQIRLLQAAVGPGAAGSDAFTASVAVVPQVHRVVAHLRVVGDTTATDHDLRSTGERDADGWAIWQLDAVAIPKGAAVRLKLYYWLDGIRYKDDNAGLYYLVHQGEPEHVPPPPAALAEAAKAWA
jgi:hypothetical protein